jgi:hypothetical protein
MFNALKTLLSDVADHIPVWQVFGALGAAGVLWVVRQRALAKLVVVVAFFAWLMSYAADSLNLRAGLSDNAWQLAVVGASLVVIFGLWLRFIR